MSNIKKTNKAFDELLDLKIDEIGAFYKAHSKIIRPWERLMKGGALHEWQGVNLSEWIISNKDVLDKWGQLMEDLKGVERQRHRYLSNTMDDIMEKIEEIKRQSGQEPESEPGEKH